MIKAASPSKGGRMAKTKREISLHKLVAPKYPPRQCLEPTCGKTFSPDAPNRFRCSDACYLKAWVADGTLSASKADELLQGLRERNAESLAKMKAAVARRRAENEKGGLTEGSSSGLMEGTSQQDPEDGETTKPKQGEEEVAMTTEPTATTTAPKIRKPKAAKKAANTRKAKAASSGKGIIGPEYRKEYAVDRKNKTASGNPTVSNGDRIAQAMRGLDLDACSKVAKENKLQDKFSGWAKLNPGQQRMNLGNVLRGLVRKGEGATVQGKAIKSLGGDS